MSNILHNIIVSIPTAMVIVFVLFGIYFLLFEER